MKTSIKREGIGKRLVLTENLKLRRREREEGGIKTSS
jgi:hypothetical protein